MDIAVNGFSGGRFKRTYYDMGIFNPNAASCNRNKIASCYRHCEQRKIWKYEELVLTVELAYFMAVILSCTGGCSKITTRFLKRLASLLSHNKTVLGIVLRIESVINQEKLHFCCKREISMLPSDSYQMRTTVVC